jgi:DNA-3-methyladenine glycosylase II
MEQMNSTVMDKTTLQKAAQYLSERDPVLKPIIERAGVCTIQPHTDYYKSLADSIIGQQLSVKAAASIRTRFYDLFGGALPTPEAILTKTPEELRAIGFSRAKAAYVQDLAQHIIDGKLSFADIEEQSNEAIIRMLTDVKGIGEWTAHMFLMFCMGRMDVLPVGDLGIRNGIKNLCNLEASPTPTQITNIAHERGWHPYESVASWYIWYSLDNKPAI